ncbi:MAG: hypothetical protein U0575_08965 [Phycisphaerales bacterium]
MIELGERLALILEAREQIRRSHARSKDLDRDPLREGVGSHAFIDLARQATANKPDEFELTHARARREACVDVLRSDLWRGRTTAQRGISRRDDIVNRQQALDFIGEARTLDPQRAEMAFPRRQREFDRLQERRFEPQRIRHGVSWG